jgi:hypothetical protein
MGENGRRYAEENFGLARLTDDLISRLTSLAAENEESLR